jgi:predicted ATPase/DNA-binding XRE family transcriptional regulator
MKDGAPTSFGAQLKALREAAGFTQEELATIAGLSVHAVSALERGHRRRPQLETVRALSAALDLAGPTRDALFASARAGSHTTSSDQLEGIALPVPLTALLGRDDDLEALRQWMADPTARLITLTGSGGVGKTRLAIEFARTVAEAGSTHVGFVALASIRDPGVAACAIAEALGLADISASDLPKRARAACEGRPTLLVLDNFEQVLDAAPVVADLLTATTTLRLLVTSRAPLRIRGEREYLVEPLALDTDPASMADVTGSPAVQLFAERVRDVQPAFRVTSDNASIVAAICRRLDALPLALELAAPWSRVLTVEELLRRLEQDVLLSAAAPRDMPERQQTMNATVAWSYQLLSPKEQRAFRRFGALPGPFSIDAAAQVLAGRQGWADSTQEALHAAAGLIDKSLLLRVDRSRASTRPLYCMLETVRAFAALELAAASERDDAMEGVVRYCAREASSADTGLVGPAQAEWLDRVQEDLASYHSALTWLIEGRRPSEALDIAWGLLWFWVIRGHSSEGLRWYERILKLPLLPTAAESRAQLGASLISYAQGQFERARTGLDRALTLARGSGDLDVAVKAEWLFGHLEYALGHYAVAREWFDRSVEGFKAVPIPWGSGNALIGLARVALAAGDAHEAERLLDDAIATLRQAGPWFLSRALYVRAILAVRRGKADEAIVLVRESLTHIRELGDKFAFVYASAPLDCCFSTTVISRALVPLAAAAALKGDDEWSARILGARDAVTDRTGTTAADESVDDLREQSERGARARLGQDQWDRAYAAGRRASIDSLLKEIEAYLHQHAGDRPRSERARGGRRGRMSSRTTHTGRP